MFPIERNGLKLVGAVGKVTPDKEEWAIDMVIVPVADGSVILVAYTDAKQDPVYTSLMKQLEFTPNRLAKCKRDYPLRVKAWLSLLEPHMARK